MGKKKKFTKEQLAIIRRNYAQKAAQEKIQRQELVVPTYQPPKSTFKLPLKNGGRRWNIFRVSNAILNGKQDNEVHGGLVLDEMNNKVLLVEITHSSKDGKRNNMHIRNLRSNDLDEKGNLRDSYIRKRLVVSIITRNGEEGIDISALYRQMNDMHFTEIEKQAIIDELSNLSTAEAKYKKFIDLANKKE